MKINMKSYRSLWILPGVVFFAACAPKVYVMDRHTIMEEEAAGDWPQLDQLSANDLAQPGATPLATDPEQEEESNNRKILNGEAVKKAK